ncbi:MAG: hypothetical protein NXI20_00520 [bacterium]|nr:hypothetical protein [bacterium]
MKSAQILTILIALGILSCNSPANHNTSQTEEVSADSQEYSTSMEEYITQLSTTEFWFPLVKQDSSEVYVTHCAGGSVNFKIDAQGQEVFMDFTQINYYWRFKVEDISEQNDVNTLKLLDTKTGNNYSLSYSKISKDRINMLDLEVLNQVEGLTLDSAYFPNLKNVSFVSFEDFNNYGKVFAYNEDCDEMW